MVRILNKQKIEVAILYIYKWEIESFEDLINFINDKIPENPAIGLDSQKCRIIIRERGHNKPTRWFSDKLYDMLHKKNWDKLDPLREEYYDKLKKLDEVKQVGERIDLRAKYNKDVAEIVKETVQRDIMGKIINKPFWVSEICFEVEGSYVDEMNEICGYANKRIEQDGDLFKLTATDRVLKRGDNKSIVFFNKK